METQLVKSLDCICSYIQSGLTVTGPGLIEEVEIRVLHSPHESRGRGAYCLIAPFKWAGGVLELESPFENQVAIITGYCVHFANYKGAPEHTDL